MDLGVAENISKSVGQISLKSEERLDFDLVDLFEAVAVELREEVYLQFVHQLLVQVCKVHSSHYPVGVDPKFLLLQLFSHQTLALLFAYVMLFHQLINNHGLLLSFSGLHAQKGAHLAEMKVH